MDAKDIKPGLLVKVVADNGPQHILVAKREIGKQGIVCARVYGCSGNVWIISQDNGAAAYDIEELEEIKMEKESSTVKEAEMTVEDIQTQAWLQGEVSGIENAVKLLHRLSGQAFEARNDEKAKFFRGAADSLKYLLDQSIEKADKHKREYCNEKEHDGKTND